MCEPGESPDPQDFSGNNVLKRLLGAGAGEEAGGRVKGRRERTEVTSLQMLSAPSLSAGVFPRPGCRAQAGLPGAARSMLCLPEGHVLCPGAAAL